ncbi:MAG: double zinc ribbon domain-containing protein [bacterium]
MWRLLQQKHPFKHRCVLCSEPCSLDKSICSSCQHDFPHNQSCCHQCAIPLSNSQDQLCGDCLKHPPAFDHAYIPLIYTFPVASMVSQFKYSAKYHYGKALAKQLNQQLKSKQFTCDWLIPVPLHKQRFLERGFNQSELIARDIQATCSASLQTKQLRRIRHTEPQAGLSAVERRRNLKAAFCCLNKLPENLHVGLVDDVVTTGTTANTLAKLLKKNGAHKITLLACARTP